jgi:dTMP kinase
LVWEQNGVNERFITFEGIDKCGKTTQAELLTKRLEESGHDVVLTLEPGGTALGQDIRKLVLGDKYTVADTTELLLFAADRAQHVEEVIKPELLAGKVVICDRFTDSTTAYQGYGRGIDFTHLKRALEIATGGLRPALTFWVDIDLKTSRERKLLENPDRLESGGEVFYENVRTGYQNIRDNEPARIVRLDGMLSIETLSNQVFERALILIDT